MYAEPDTVRFEQRYLELRVSIEDHDYGRVPSRGTQQKQTREATIKKKKTWKSWDEQF